MSDYSKTNENKGCKSWGKLKKQLQALLCDSLRTKISYFFTTYSIYETGFGRGAIRYEKQELVSFSWTAYFNQQFKDEQSSIDRNELMKEKWMQNCTLCDFDFLHAVTLFLNTDIQHSLNSENYLLRVFAYMDKRVGKRTLIKIKEEVQFLPDWVQQFYKIRCEAENFKLMEKA